MASSVDSSRAYSNFIFVLFSVSACDVICFETEIILWNHNLCEQHAILAMSHTRPSAFFLEESKRLYTICCETVS